MDSQPAFDPCPATGCRELKPRRRLCCDAHWATLPDELRERVVRRGVYGEGLREREQARAEALVLLTHHPLLDTPAAKERQALDDARRAELERQRAEAREKTAIEKRADAARAEMKRRKSEWRGRRWR